MHGFSPNEQKEVIQVITENGKLFKNKWMSTSVNSYDAIEKLIYEEGFRIEAIDIHPELDVMLVMLNTKAVLRQPLSAYKHLKDAGRDELTQYKLIGNGTGIRWPALDEDLSLKGFLRDELRNVVRRKDTAAA